MDLLPGSMKFFGKINIMPGKESYMNTYIALFRGVNVGGKNILPMKELVAIIESLGYSNVQTYIQSGNAVFQSKKKIEKNGAGDIGREILKKKGFEPKILLLSSKELQDVIKDNPFSTDVGKALHFFFLDSQPKEPNLERLESLKVESEEFKMAKSVFYLYAPDGVGRSKLAAAVEKTIDVPVTARNWNTVSKLKSMVENA